MKYAFLTSVLSLVLIVPGVAHSGTTHHELMVRLYPSEHRMEATDRVTLPPAVQEKQILLNPDLSSTVKLLDERSFEVSCSGEVKYPLRDVGREHARGQKDTAGYIGPDGIYLDGGTGWYPRFPGGGRLTFDLVVELPPGWSAVSQGRRVEHVVTGAGTRDRWVCASPQDAIWLVAGQYTEYGGSAGEVEAMAFFRRPEEELAARYLRAAGTYIGMYQDLLGPYPYPKFALVENFWETGYGMPSFTLLGPRVIRFPFIIESSYPHEILHNWFGNSVYIDYRSGNWGEGLTAYLSDHLLKEQKGLGARHRQETLQKYADYVLSERDLPLTAFRSRHGSVSQAVGYGKTLMLFHMLRLQLGDDLFREGLRDLYENYRFQTAAFGDVRTVFEGAAQQKLGWFFDQWVLESGAPVLKAGQSPTLDRSGGQYSLTLNLLQVQEGGPYRLAVPLAVTLEGREEAELLTVTMESSSVSTTIELDEKPMRVDVDPLFDLFRRLDRREVPPALTQAFGARKAMIVLPAQAPPPMLESYRGLAQFLTEAGPGFVTVVEDSALTALPGDSSVWLVGWENRFLKNVRRSFEAFGCRFDTVEGVFEIPGESPVRLTRKHNAVVLAARHPADPDLAVLFIAADNAASHEGLARKLPHYHKYSYLGFSGDEPENVVKGRWPVVDSPLTVFPGGGEPVPMGRLPERKPLVDMPVR